MKTTQINMHQGQPLRRAQTRLFNPGGYENDSTDRAESERNFQSRKTRTLMGIHKTIVPEKTISNFSDIAPIN